MIALRGSVLGVGTDIGGSARIPALCNGIYAFKPTSRRIPTGRQAWGSRRGSPGFPSIAGPLANTFEDLVLFVQTVLSARPWDLDATCIAYPWRTEIANAAPARKRIGYFVEDPELLLQPPVLRALETARETLMVANFEVIPLSNTPSLITGKALVNGYWSLDNSNETMKHVFASGEPIIPSLRQTAETPDTEQNESTLDDLWDLNVACEAYKAAWHRQWIDNKVDVVLCAGAQTTAVPHDTYEGIHYTAVWNLLEVCTTIDARI